MKITSIVFEEFITTINLDNGNYIQFEIDAYISCCETFGIDVTDGLLCLCEGNIIVYRGDRGYRRKYIILDCDIPIEREYKTELTTNHDWMYHEELTLIMPKLILKPFEFFKHEIVFNRVNFLDENFTIIGVVYFHSSTGICGTGPTECQIRDNDGMVYKC